MRRVDSVAVVVQPNLIHLYSVLYFSSGFTAFHLYLCYISVVFSLHDICIFISGQLHLNCTAVVFVLCGSCICIVWELNKPMQC